MNLAYGFIETRGLVGAIEAADAMLKAAKVRLVKKQKIGSALVTIIVEGELGACQAAVNAGSAAAERIGTLISAHVIPRPFTDTEMLIKDYFDPITPMPTIPEDPIETKSVVDVKKIAASQSKVSSASKENDFMLWLADQKNGVRLDQIAQKLGKDQAEARRMIKHLMDEELIEKVHQKYFFLHKGKKK